MLRSLTHSKCELLLNFRIGAFTVKKPDRKLAEGLFSASDCCLKDVSTIYPIFFWSSSTTALIMAADTWLVVAAESVTAAEEEPVWVCPAD